MNRGRSGKGGCADERDFRPSHGSALRKNGMAEREQDQAQARNGCGKRTTGSTRAQLFSVPHRSFFTQGAVAILDSPPDRSRAGAVPLGSAGSGRGKWKRKNVCLSGTPGTQVQILDTDA